MELIEIAQRIGIRKCPPVLEEVFANLEQTDAPACDIELIDKLQEEFDVFAEFYDVVRATAMEVNADPLRSAWVKTAVAYAKDKNVVEAKVVPVPEADGTQITALLPLYILLPMIPMGIETYRRRGFSEEELAGLMKGYASGIRIVNSQVGMPCVNSLYYGWLLLFAKAVIFNTDGLQFELRRIPEAVIYLRNREDGQIVLVVTTGRIHRSGIQPLGSAGYTDDAGAFDADFAEDDENYYGHGIYDDVISSVRRTYPKAQWDCIARAGDECLSFHIPVGADISEENVRKAIASAHKIVRERYPEHHGMLVYGSSWILDPILAGILGPNSKITRLLQIFCKYPEKDDGTSLFGYVFPKNYESVETLPEDTSLQRKLKQVYLEGNYLHSYAGLILK